MVELPNLINLLHQDHADSHVAEGTGLSVRGLVRLEPGGDPL